MRNQTKKNASAINARFDRLCEHLASRKIENAPWGLVSQRGALDLSKDGALHRRFHSFYEDLLN